jgi:hypothetical protein
MKSLKWLNVTALADRLPICGVFLSVLLPKCFQAEKLGQFRRSGVNADREYSEAHRDHPF